MSSFEKSMEEILREQTETERTIGQACDKAWDSVRLPVCDLLLEGKINRREYRAIESIFRSGFERKCLSAEKAGTTTCVQFKCERITAGTVSVAAHFSDRSFGETQKLFFDIRGHFFVDRAGKIRSADSYTTYQTTVRARRHPLIFGWNS